MPSANITALQNLVTPQPTMLLYAGLSPFGATDDRKVTANNLFSTITANISDISLQFDNGLGTATVSAAGKGKIRYNDTAKAFQFSADGAAYANFGGGMAIGGVVTGGTTGSVLFVAAGPVLAQDNANFFWDGTNHRLGIGTTSPDSPLTFSSATANKINLLQGGAIGFGVRAGRFEIFTQGGADIFLGQGPGGGMTDVVTVSVGNPAVNIQAAATTARGLFVTSAANSTIEIFRLSIGTNVTNTIAPTATWICNNSGLNAVTGFGSSLAFQLGTSSFSQDAVTLTWFWVDGTQATRSAAYTIQIVDHANALAEKWRIAGNSAGTGTLETLTGVNGSQRIEGEITELLTLSTVSTTT